MKKLFRVIIIFTIIFTLVINILTPQQISAAEDKKYLVIVGQIGGCFKAYDNLAANINGHIMVKAKPLASALGAKYSTRTGSTKGCIMTIFLL